MSKRQVNVMFIATLLITGTVLLQMTLYVLSILAGWEVRFNLVTVCHSIVKSIGLSFLEYGLDALVFFTVFLLVRKVSSQIFWTKRMQRIFEYYKENKLTLDLNDRHTNGREAFTVISYPAPIAVTMGFIKPRIVLSTGMMQLLDEGELEAVILHELYHQNNHDPLKIFLISLCASTMWYIPILRWFHQRFKIVKELLADEHALDKQGTPVNIGSALLKMLKARKQAQMPFSYVSFADTSVNYRIKYILDPLTEPPLKIPLKLTVMSFSIFSILCGLFIYALS
ncbi:M56 family metallopeptidase [Lederbergia lenta]|uniref:M56 domain-containing peptidase n=1 Tax=Lederbergia lenta TaxID=1467 RepID=A0A2X4W973_LEDLE|nr:M56 family metallopeptidase [Lederbergia lenta]MEC2324995.1 M56 family metallopeptidase [Lederbergia lenta]SQI56508.1 M56 domain-containing peptidase [Lederbergia lenta]